MSVSAISSDGSLNILILRANSALDTYVLLVTYQNGSGIFWEMNAVVGGTTVASPSGTDSGSVGSTKANNLITFLCDNGNRFKIELNGSTIINQTITGSSIGSAFRNFGIGVATGATLPGSFTQVSLAAQAAVAGSTFRRYRTLTASSGSLGSGAQPFPASFFDTLDYCTPDLTDTPASNEVTVSIAGTYSVSIVLLPNWRGITVADPHSSMAERRRDRPGHAVCRQQQLPDRIQLPGRMRSR